MSNVIHHAVASGNAATSAAVVLPADVLDGDWAIAIIGLSTTAALTPPSGYTSIQDFTFATATRRFAAYKKALTAAGDASATHTWTFTSSNYAVQHYIVRGADATTPINASNTKTAAASTTWSITSGLAIAAGGDGVYLNICAFAADVSSVGVVGTNLNTVTGSFDTNISVCAGWEWITAASGAHSATGASGSYAAVDIYINSANPDGADTVTPPNVQALSSAGVRPVAAGFSRTYRMRGTVSGSPVYWNAPIPDDTAAYYTGAGTVTDIVVTRIFGA